MPVRAVLFDLDDTLVPEVAAWSAAFEVACTGLAQEHGIPLAQLEASVFGVAREIWEASPYSAWCDALGLGSPSSLLSDFPGPGPELAYLRSWAPRYRHEAWTAGLIRAGLPPGIDVAALSTAFRQAFKAGHRVFDDVEPCLRRLRGIKLAVVTNGASDLQRDKLCVGHLDTYFEAVVISSEVGTGKPDAAIFCRAIEALSVSADQAIMVGDSPRRDIAGAQAAGLRAVLLDRAASRAESDLPYLRIESLSELPALIQSMS